MNKFDKLGWIAAAGLAGIMIGGGFQGGQTKIGVVDFGKLLDTNEHATKSKSTLMGLQKSREELLQFLATNRKATADQLNKYKTLSIKDKLSSAEQAELDKLKVEIPQAEAKYQALSQKKDLTTNEQMVLNQLASLGRANEPLIQQFVADLDKELNERVGEHSKAVTDKARQSLEELGKAGGYTVIFDVRMAPYGATDVTENALKALNAKK